MTIIYSSIIKGQKDPYRVRFKKFSQERRTRCKRRPQIGHEKRSVSIMRC